ISVNRIVSVDRLFEALWGEELPQSAPKALHSHMSRLRQALASAGATLKIETRPGGYVLLAGEDELDVTAVERLVTRSRPALASGDPDTSAARLTEALATWRGASLGDMAERSFAIAEATRPE